MKAARGRGALAAESAADAVERLLAVYAQILFSRSATVGLILLLATAVVPRAALFGVVAVATATFVARALGLERAATDAGAYGYNALLLGLGASQSFEGGPSALAIAVVAAAVSVVLTAGMKSLLGVASLPALTLPFVVIWALVSAARHAAGAGPAPHDADAMATLVGAGALASFAKSLGALFFLPRVDAGALVLLALLVHSRISTVLAMLAFAFAALAAHALGALGEGLLPTLGYNGMLTAVALGAVWYVPSVSSFLVGLLGAGVSMLVAVGGAAALAGTPMSIGILPLNAAVLLMLAALRRRDRDDRPRSVDFMAGTPEENLAYSRGVHARFGWLYPVAIRLPFRGTWVCTQGVDGDITHKGDWRHGFDFEVRDADGQLFRGEGGALDDYHCWRLPVLAAADGVVVEVETSLADNPVGQQDLERNWGNYVLVWHADGLYSLVAHLAHKSVKVKAGQSVKRGDLLGLSGSSGRSPRPHLHFQLQAGAKVGAPTIPCAFNDVVASGGERGPRLVRKATPKVDEELRNAEADGELGAHLAFVPGDEWVFRTAGRDERVGCEIDLYGRRLLVSRDAPATLYYAADEDAFTVLDVVGDRKSVLHVLRAALSRVPFDATPGLAFGDTLPARELRPLVWRVLSDFVAPFRTNDGVEMTYRMHREGGVLVVKGESEARARGGATRVRTRAELTRGAGPARLELVVNDVSVVAERMPAEAAKNEGALARPKEQR